MANSITWDWSGADVAETRLANVVIAQDTPEGVLVSFGYIAPPAALASMNDEETREFLAANPINVSQPSRVLLTPNAAAVLANSLQSHPVVREIITRARETSENKEDGNE